MLLVTLLLSFVSSASLFCFPGQSLKECISKNRKNHEDLENTENTIQNIETYISPRDSLFKGRLCFSSQNYYGTCKKPRNCAKRNYSYSRTCGWKLVCCEGKDEEQTTTTIPLIRRTTKIPQTRRTKNIPQTRRRQQKPLIRRRTKILPTRRTTKIPIIKTTTKISTIKRTTVKPPPIKESCGGSSLVPFIFGGKEASQGQFPFMVSFVFTYPGGEEENFCGGVLITRRHVLTAAHCFVNVQEREWRSGEVGVRVGTVRLNEKIKDNNKVNIDKVKIHSHFKRKSGGGKVGLDKDIAIVTLENDINSRTISPICLPTKQRYDYNYTGSVVAGWGKTSSRADYNSDHLMYADITTLSVAKCQAMYNKLLAGKGAKVDITPNMLCGGDSSTDTCQGDSGGPMMYTDSNYRWTVAGIVSFGPSSCGNGVPGVYTRVDRYLDWIYQHI